MSETLVHDYTSTGEKLWWHQEAMQNLRNGKGMPVVAHILPEDRCQDFCSFCSVMTRAGNQLPFGVVKGILDQLVPIGLKAIIISGAGNPILYKCKLTGKDINDVIDEIHGRGLQIGMISNGMPLKEYPCGRTSWKTVKPETLDKLTWLRISMSGLDHKRRVVEVPDVDQSKTTLGFSWIMADQYDEPLEPNHGQVGTLDDLITPLKEGDGRAHYVMDRMPWIEEQIRFYVEKYNPRYARFLANCNQPELIPERHAVLSAMAKRIDPTRCFSQFKPPRQPQACYKGYPHPVINSDGYLYSCDSVVLNKDAHHKFNNKWRVCRWDEITELYSKPIRPLVPNDICPGCVFSGQVDLLSDVVNGRMEIPPSPATEPEHSSFI